MKDSIFPSDRGLYRSRRGIILGVCRGLSDYFNLRVGWVRLLTVAVALVSGIWPVLIIYLIAGILMKPEPMISRDSEVRPGFDNGDAACRHRTLQDLKARFTALDRRLRRMEDKVTSRDFEWENRLNG